MIDTHAHLQLDEFAADRDAVLQRALDNGIERILCIGSNRKNSLEAVELATRYEYTYATIGVHPLDEYVVEVDQARKILINLLATDKNKRIVAIGECGLDFYSRDGAGVSKEEVSRQTELFLMQLDLAYTYDLPVVFHINKAYDELLEIIDQHKKQGRQYGGIFHFYTGGKKRIQKILDLGDFYFGIGGAVTYDAGIAEVVKAIPLDRIVLETDCPYVAPEPHRGERNEPAYLPMIAEKIAQLKGVSVEEVVRATTQSANAFFGL